MWSIKMEAFDSRTSTWTQVANIVTNGYKEDTWYFFGRVLNAADESRHGILPEFSNPLIYPTLRFQLEGSAPSPVDFNIRIPKFGSLIGISALVKGVPQVVSNTITTFSIPSWGYILLGNVAGQPVTPPVYKIYAKDVGLHPLSCGSQATNLQELAEELCSRLKLVSQNIWIPVPWQDVTSQIIPGQPTSIIHVPHLRYIPSSLEVDRNGQLLDYPAIEEVDPSQGSCKINFPIEMGERIRVSYRISIVF